MSNLELYQGNCLELMSDIADNSIDCIICDLPYGTTSCSWDIIIPLDKLWEQYNRIIKDIGKSNNSIVFESLYIKEY